jgi:hypothetical protein
MRSRKRAVVVLHAADVLRLVIGESELDLPPRVAPTGRFDWDFVRDSLLMEVAGEVLSTVSDAAEAPRLFIVRHAPEDRPTKTVTTLEVTLP